MHDEDLESTARSLTRRLADDLAGSWVLGELERRPLAECVRGKQRVPWPRSPLRDPVGEQAVTKPGKLHRRSAGALRADRGCGSIQRTVDALPDWELLVAARRGEPAAFERLVSRHRRGLLVHCYRMLGSVQDAEDALQESLLGAWRGLATFEGRSSVRAWLYTITTKCLPAAGLAHATPDPLAGLRPAPPEER
jgi:hypothetical protein